jgi:hypothetical protein
VADIPVDTGVVLQGNDSEKAEQSSGPVKVPSPSSPSALSPQQSTPPEVRMAQYPTPAAARLVAEMPVADGVGLHGFEYKHMSGPLLEPLPSWPAKLAPQQSTPPEVRMAQELLPLVTTLVPETPVDDGVGLHGENAQVSGPLLEPLPSSPVELSPQQSTAPEVRTAQKFAGPPVRLVAEMPVEIGLVLQGKSPSPE